MKQNTKTVKISSKSFVLLNELQLLHLKRKRITVNKKNLIEWLLMRAIDIAEKD